MNPAKASRGITTFSMLFPILIIMVIITSIITTYAFILSFRDSEMEQIEVVLNVEEVRFFNTTTRDYVEVIVRNMGTTDVVITSIYAGSSDSNRSLQKCLNCDPCSHPIAPGSAIILLISYDWKSESKHYFNIATESGQTFLFTEEIRS